MSATLRINAFEEESKTPSRSSFNTSEGEGESMEVE